ncbi:MAG: M24 family metallopeptidase [Gaiellales bacterium]
MVPNEQIDRRLEALRQGLAADGADAALIVQNTDLAYFSGTNQQAHLLVPASGEPRLLVRRTVERARAESPLAHIEPLRSLSELPAALADAGLHPGARVGMELDVLPAAGFLGYRRRLEGYELVDCSPVVREVRAVKTGWDLERMRGAAAQVDAGARAVPGLIRPGISESKVQLEVEKALREAGHQGQIRFRGFNQEMHYGQVLGGPSGAVPGYSDSPLCGPGPNPAVGKGADGRVLEPGDPVIVDLVGGCDGWLADQTRTFFVGRAPGDLRDAYATAVDILRAAERGMCPGAVPAELYERARERAAQAGLEQHFMGAGPDRVRFLGHGVGMEIDELPILAPGFDRPLVPGNVLAVEPKFVFPGRGAVGIENMYVVTDDGCETLTTAPEELIEV